MSRCREDGVKLNLSRYIIQTHPGCGINTSNRHAHKKTVTFIRVNGHSKRSGVSQFVHQRKLFIIYRSSPGLVHDPVLMSSINPEPGLLYIRFNHRPVSLPDVQTHFYVFSTHRLFFTLVYQQPPKYILSFLIFLSVQGSAIICD